MTNPLLTADNLVSAPIEHGDAGVILKPDGTWKVFSTGELGRELSPEQREQGERLLALAVALKEPTIMEVLKKMSRDPKMVGSALDLGKLN